MVSTSWGIWDQKVFTLSTWCESFIVKDMDYTTKSQASIRPGFSDETVGKGRFEGDDYQTP